MMVHDQWLFTDGGNDYSSCLVVMQVSVSVVTHPQVGYGSAKGESTTTQPSVGVTYVHSQRYHTGFFLVDIPWLFQVFWLQPALIRTLTGKVEIDDSYYRYALVHKNGGWCWILDIQTCLRTVNLLQDLRWPAQCGAVAGRVRWEPAARAELCRSEVREEGSKHTFMFPNKPSNPVIFKFQANYRKSCGWSWSMVSKNEHVWIN